MKHATGDTWTCHLSISSAGKRDTHKFVPQKWRQHHFVSSSNMMWQSRRKHALLIKVIFKNVKCMLYQIYGCFFVLWQLIMITRARNLKFWMKRNHTACSYILNKILQKFNTNMATIKIFKIIWQIQCCQNPEQIGTTPSPSPPPPPPPPPPCTTFEVKRKKILVM